MAKLIHLIATDNMLPGSFRDFTEIKAALTVTDCYCGLEGLEISYTLDGEERLLEVFPERSAELLKMAGVIEDYRAADDLYVTVAMDSFCYDRTQEIPWAAFILGWDGLCRSDAVNVAAHYEHLKQLQASFKIKGGRS